MTSTAPRRTAPSPLPRPAPSRTARLSDTPYASEIARIGDQLLSRLREPSPV